MLVKHREIPDNEPKAFNAQRLAVLVKNEVGSRTHIVFCEERKVSRTTLYSILNDKLDAPPSARTLVKIAGSNQELCEELLAACGYDLVAWKRATENAKRRSVSKQLVLPEAENHAVRGLMLVLSILKRIGKDKAYQWEYPENDAFTLTSKDYEIVCLPAFCENELGADYLHNQVCKQLIKLAFYFHGTNTGGHRKKCCLVITNSAVAYEKLLTAGSMLTAMPFRCAVALCSDGKTIIKQKDVLMDTAQGSLHETFPLCLVGK